MADEWSNSLWAAADLVTPMAIRVAATLRIADHLDATAAQLAEVTGADQDALRRVLDHLVTAGVLTRDDDTYGLTALGEQLPGLGPWLDLEGSIGRADLSFIHLLHTVRTGEPAFPVLYGTPYWDDLAANPERAAHFDALMGSRLTDAPEIAAEYPWGDAGHLVDVGGGDGTLLIAILRAHQGVRGTVADLPGPAARAEAALAAAGLSERAGVHAGSFFDELPKGDCVLSGVLHDWDDEAATRILRRCAEAAGPDGRVLVVDPVGHPDTEGDLRMLAYVKGRERDLDRLHAIAAAAGLSPGPVTPVGFRSVVELRVR